MALLKSRVPFCSGSELELDHLSEAAWVVHTDVNHEARLQNKPHFLQWKLVPYGIMNNMTDSYKLPKPGLPLANIELPNGMVTNQSQ